MKLEKAKIKKTFILNICLAAFSIPVLASAATYVPMEEIPGFGRPTDFFDYVQALYNFGIAAIGIAALIMLGIGGFMYITSAGNASRMETAKEYIWDAIIGLILALSAYLILYTINPDLVRLIRPTVTPVPIVGPPSAPPAGIPGPPGGGATAGCPYPSISCCKPATNCAACRNCVEVTGIACKESPCYLNSDLLTRLQLVNSSLSWRITEPWPPTVFHMDSCHARGTCADVNLLNGSSSVSDVKILSDALRAAGFTSYTYESRDCAPYSAAGIPCKDYATRIGSSFHVNL